MARRSARTRKPDIFFGQVGLLRKSDWEFRQRGESGLWVSEMFPHLAGVADHLTVIRSMVADSASHTPALSVQNSGFGFNGYPALGSWLSYGLGNETDSLPTRIPSQLTRAIRSPCCPGEVHLSSQPHEPALAENAEALSGSFRADSPKGRVKDTRGAARPKRCTTSEWLEEEDDDEDELPSSAVHSLEKLLQTSGIAA